MCKKYFTLFFTDVHVVVYASTCIYIMFNAFWDFVLCADSAVLCGNLQMGLEFRVRYSKLGTRGLRFRIGVWV